MKKTDTVKRKVVLLRAILLILIIANALHKNDYIATSGSVCATYVHRAKIEQAERASEGEHRICTPLLC